MTRLLVMLTVGLISTLTACAAGPGKLTPESREALERLRAERIMCPISLFTNCTLVADFSVTIFADSSERTFTGRMSTTNRSFSFAHGYIGKMFDEPVTISTGSDTTGYAARLDRWVKDPLDFDVFLGVFTPRKNSFTIPDAQLDYLGTENGVSRYKAYYTFMEQIPVECYYWCDLQTRCITRAAVALVLADGSRISGEIFLNPYSGISRTSYPQDGCYLKYARQIDYRYTDPKGNVLQTIRLWNIQLEDIGVYKTGRKSKE